MSRPENTSPRKGWKRWLPDPAQLKEERWMRPFRRWLDDPALWRFSRRSVAFAAALGLFCCYLPMPLQTLPAAALAIFLRINLPVAVALCWISNPLTLPPMIYAAWFTGDWLVGFWSVTAPVNWAALDWSLGSLSQLWDALGTPFLIGSFLNGAVLAIAGHLLTHALWKRHVLNKRQRAARIRRVNYPSA